MPRPLLESFSIAMDESNAASQGLPLDVELSLSIRNSSALKGQMRARLSIRLPSRDR
jgi:hypothetical protein